jgi:hypothetical protein
VAEFGGDAVRAADQFTAEDDAAADAGTHGEEHHRLGSVGRGAELELGPGRHVGVVLHHHRHRDMPDDLVAQRLVAPGQVGGEQHGGALGVDPAGGADADRVHLVGGGQLVDDLDDPVQGLRGVLGGSVPTCLGHQVAVLIDDAAEHLGTADVDTDGQTHHALPPKTRPAAPAAGRLTAPRPVP